MDSFEELDVAPELVEALAAEGIERPTPLQEAAIPILRKGNNLVLSAGPGSGLLLAWLVPLLERLEPGGHTLRILALTATSETADRLAESTARLTAVTGHSVAALGSPWLRPERAQIIFGTPADVLALTVSGGLALSEVQTIVVDQAQIAERLGGFGDVERVIDYVPPDAQRILSALPVTAGVSDLVERHFRRALTLPVPDPDKPPSRGSIRFRVVSEPRESAALAIADELLPAVARHLLFFCRSEDQAADLGDYLTLHGFVAGAPGEESLAVWLGVDALEARAAAKGVEGVVVVSCDVPADPDTLDRRHAIGTDSVVLVLPRELAHLKRLGRETGYDTVPFPPPVPGAPTSIDELRAALEQAIQREDTAPYLAVLAPLFERFDPSEVAAAAVALLRGGRPQGETPPSPSPASAEPAAEPAWAKLFIGVGERDGLRPADLLGAITGEAGVDGRSVGKIEIKESHSVVEVHDSVARKVIKAINGTTIRGRAVRADFDRPRRGAPRAPRPR